ncbi:hypothetical protein VTO73DRAFT_1588 [Trametes versicolor]
MLQAKKHARYRWLRLRASRESLTTTSPRKAIDLFGRLPTDPPARAWTAEVSPHTFPAESYYARPAIAIIVRSTQRPFVLAEVTTPHSLDMGALPA